MTENTTESKPASEALGIKSTNPKDRIGVTKPALTLVSPIFLLHVAQAMKDGATKYGPYNWRAEDVSARVYVDAALRHLLAWADGEEVARDSKHHHLAHAAACFAILLDAQTTGHLVDDRFKSGKVADLIAQFTETKGFTEKVLDRLVAEFSEHYPPTPASNPEKFGL